MDFTFWGEIIAIVILICLSAFFAGSETAMTAVSKARMHGLAQKGDKHAQQVIEIRNSGERMIGALLMGNSMVNILASALATSVLITIFGDNGVFYATAIMSAMIIIFAEVLPKTYALYHADRMAPAVSPLVKQSSVATGLSVGAARRARRYQAVIASSISTCAKRFRASR